MLKNSSQWYAREGSDFPTERVLIAKSVHKLLHQLGLI